jgi:hypothetical protein
MIMITEAERKEPGASGAMGVRGVRAASCQEWDNFLTDVAHGLPRNEFRFCENAIVTPIKPPPARTEEPLRPSASAICFGHLSYVYAGRQWHLSSPGFQSREEDYVTSVFNISPKQPERPNTP